MVDKVPDIQSITNLRDESSVVQAINTNFSNLKSFFASLLSTTTAGNNTMNVPLDMNGQRLINYPAPLTDLDLVRRIDVRQLLLNIPGFIKGDKGDKGDPGSAAASSNPPDDDNSLLVATTNWVNKKLGGGIPGFNWTPYEKRILITKTHQPNEVQPALDIQVNTRDGNIPGNAGGIGSSVGILTRGGAGTKYGHFGFISVFENRSVQNAGDASFGHVSEAPYMFVYDTNSPDSWAIAAEVREFTGTANPVNGRLVAELGLFATGTDDFNKRCGLFLPANKHDPGDGIFTEFAQGIFWNTTPNTKFKNAMYLRGQYDSVLNADGLLAGTLIKATGNYSGPVIDLHSVSTAGDSCALGLNSAHSIQWRNANNAILGAIAYDIDTPILTGVKRQNNVGGSAGYAVLNINGTRFGIPLFNLG